MAMSVGAKITNMPLVENLCPGPTVWWSPMSLKGIRKCIKRVYSVRSSRDTEVLSTQESDRRSGFTFRTDLLCTEEDLQASEDPPQSPTPYDMTEGNNP